MTLNITRALIRNLNAFQKGRNGQKVLGVVLHTEGLGAHTDTMKDHSLNFENGVVSAHYLVTFSGHIYQYVLDEDTAYHAGNWPYNTKTIGIEHQDNGYWRTTDHPRYTEAQYQASGELVARLCEKFHIPTQHPASVPGNPSKRLPNGILIHREVPNVTKPCPGTLDYMQIIRRAHFGGILPPEIDFPTDAAPDTPSGRELPPGQSVPEAF